KVSILSRIAAKWLQESIIILIGFIFAAPAFANTVTADCADPATKLQAIINKATTGELILVRGTCVGQFQIPTQTIRLQGFGENPTLDANQRGFVLNIGSQIFGSGRVIVSGLILRNGDIVSSGTTTLTHCTVTARISNFMAGMTIRASIIEGGISNSLGGMTI